MSARAAAAGGEPHGYAVHWISLLNRIDAYVKALQRRHCDAVDVPPFTVFLHREPAHPYLSYAVPGGRLDGDSLPVLAAVRETFERNGRPPRWEFIVDLYPELLPALRAAGFTGLEETPLMTVAPDSFRPREVPGVEIRPPRDREELVALTRVQAVAFWGRSEAAEEDVRGMEKHLECGTRLLGAFDGGEAVASGVHTPIDGSTEVAGIATLPERRRRGLGAAVTSALVADAFALGCDCVFLTPGDEAARSVYERVGFRRIGTAVMMKGDEP